MPEHKSRKARARNAALRRIAQVLQTPGGTPEQRRVLRAYRERIKAEKALASNRSR